MGCFKILRRAIKQPASMAGIQPSDNRCDGDLVKSKAVASRVFFVSFVSLVLSGIAIWNFPALTVAQSAVSDDVKRDTPGQVIKKGQSLHMDVDLALVNVTVTDPYDRLVRALSPITSVFSKTTSKRRYYF